jgi:hypothetical protein
MPLDTNPPPWLQKNWEPHHDAESSGGGGSNVLGWLNFANQLSVQQQTLPLEVKSRTLQNQHAELALQQETMNVNDALEQQGFEKAEAQRFADFRAQVNANPRGTQGVETPFFQATRYNKWASDRQAFDNKTDFVKQVQETNAGYQKEALEIFKDHGPLVQPDPKTGTYDPIELGKARKVADENKLTYRGRELQQTADASDHYNVTAGHLAETQAELRQSEAATAGMDEGNPLYATGKERQAFLKDKIQAMQSEMPGSRYGANHGTAQIQNFAFRQNIKEQIDAAEADGDYETADSLREGLGAFDRAHEGSQVRAHYNALVQERAGIMKALGEPWNKVKWPAMQDRLKQIDGELSNTPSSYNAPRHGNGAGANTPGTTTEPPQPVAPPAATHWWTPKTRYQWTPTGVIQK